MSLNERKVLNEITRVCEEYLGFEGAIQVNEVLATGKNSRNAIFRCELSGATPPVPTEVIAKIHTTVDGHGYTELAGLDFLNNIPSLRGTVPILYGSNRKHKLIVMEDLQSENFQLLSDILTAGDSDTASKALLALASTIGKLHRETVGLEERYEALRSELPRSQGNFLVDRTTEALERIPQIIRRFGLSPHPSFAEQLQAAVSELSGSSSLRSYTSGDICPTNVAICNGEAKIFDFEMGGYRNALLDGVYPHLRHLGCSYGNRIPFELQCEMSAVYRSTLKEKCKEARNDATFARALVSASAGWTAVILSKIESTQKDREWGTSTVRQRAIHALSNLHAVVERYNQLPYLGRTVEDLLHLLCSRWSMRANSLPLFPAFQHG